MVSNEDSKGERQLANGLSYYFSDTRVKTALIFGNEESKK